MLPVPEPKTLWFPRTRGDRPQTVSVTWALTGGSPAHAGIDRVPTLLLTTVFERFPRTRGDRPRMMIRHRRAPVRGSPAHAGIDRGWLWRC